MVERTHLQIIPHQAKSHVRGVLHLGVCVCVTRLVALAN